jgi:uncharacterized membrane protein
MTAKSKPAPKAPLPVQKIPAGPRLRLILAGVIGLAGAVAIPSHYGPTVRALLGWELAVGSFIVLILRMMAGSTPDHMRLRAAQQDQGKPVILTAIVAGALFSLAALVLIQKPLKSAEGAALAFYLGIMASTIFLSWFLVHMVFTLHYAHAYYGAAEDENDEDGLVGGLDFPSEKQPDYWDFMYFSFVIGMTCQVSDVQVTGRKLRRLALIHGIVSFFFNTIILALTINIVASVI